MDGIFFFMQRTKKDKVSEYNDNPARMTWRNA